MSDGSKIEWTQGDDGTPGATWNPVTGCTKISPGCDHCYAETFAERWRGVPGHHFENGFDVTLRPERLGQPLRWQRPRRIFVNSMSDLWHQDVPDEYIAQVWQAMGIAPQHTYLILTKRHARMRSWVTRWYSGEIAEPYEVRPVPGFPGYSITTHGEVLGKRSDTRAGLRPDAGEHGHLRVTMHRDSSPRSGERQLVHRIELTAFVRPPRPGEQACHRNGDPSDNRLSNLYWGTQEDNWRDRLQHGNGRSYAKLSEGDVVSIRARGERGESAYSIARDYPVSDTQVRNILRGDQWASAGVPVRVTPPGRALLDCVWLGVSVEDEKWADIRIPALLETPAAVRFISAEPLLGPLRIRASLLVGAALEPRGGIGWLIAGGESGPGARPCELEWLRSLRGQCADAAVPYFCKQLGSVLGRQLGAGPKGGDWDAWPEDLRVREFPRAAEAVPA